MRLLVQIPELSVLMAELNIRWADLLGPAYDIVGEKTEILEECLFAYLEQIHYQYLGTSYNADLYFSPYYSNEILDSINKLCQWFYYEHSGLYQALCRRDDLPIRGVVIRQTPRLLITDISSLNNFIRGEHAKRNECSQWVIY